MRFPKAALTALFMRFYILRSSAFITSSLPRHAKRNGRRAFIQRFASSYDVENASEGITGSYNPQSFESSVYSWWEESGCFDPDAASKNTGKKSEQEAYVLPMPPPNVTGRLHMGHAIFVALQDVLARFHR